MSQQDRQISLPGFEPESEAPPPAAPAEDSAPEVQPVPVGPPPESLQGQTVSGDVPFFGYPFVQLRGIPAMRYQGEEVFVGELEYLWGLTPRWTLVLFGGVGKATAIEDFFTGDEDVGAGGAGVRYRLARKQGLQAGFDIARGPEDTSFYITVGSAWF